jgi:hypothetical protein
MYINDLFPKKSDENNHLQFLYLLKFKFKHKIFLLPK